jgi:hypothetical protein
LIVAWPKTLAFVPAVLQTTVKLGVHSRAQAVAHAYRERLLETV